MSLVLDCSAAMAWCFEDEADAESDALLRRVATEGAVVPAIWRFEVANVLAMAHRRGRISAAQSARLAGLLERLPLEVAALPSISELVLHARDAGLTAYDVAYLQLAATSDLPLATRDERMAEVAHSLGVDVTG